MTKPVIITLDEIEREYAHSLGPRERRPAPDTRPAWEIDRDQTLSLYAPNHFDPNPDSGPVVVTAADIAAEYGHSLGPCEKRRAADHRSAVDIDRDQTRSLYAPDHFEPNIDPGRRHMAERMLEQAEACGVGVQATNTHLSFDGRHFEFPELCDRIRELTPEIWQVLAERDEEKEFVDAP